MTTISLAEFNLSPDIVLGLGDHRSLLELAMAGRGSASEEAEELLNELERARVVGDEVLPFDAVRMGSTVRYKAGGGAEREVVLVYPKDADIQSGRISVLTPVGTALLGLRPKQSITWVTRDGRKQMLTVLSVLPPAEDDDGPGPSAA
ncbi:MAG: nucleoside diphosphate kinase regulator [Devosia sp.]